MLAAMRVALIVSLTLGGCGTPQDATAPPYANVAPTGANTGTVPPAPRAIVPTASAPPSANASASAPAAPAPPPTTTTSPRCPADMVAIGEGFCIDRYEAPNRKGTKPLLLESAASGEAWCSARGKRLCLEREWVRACRGPHGQDFPYGHKWRRGVCNDDKTWRSPRWSAIRSYPSPAAQRETQRLDQSEVSGARAECVSPEGVFDLTGNAAEWVVRTEHNPTDFDHVVKGCYWARCFRPPHTPDCAYVNYAHQGAERSYEMGFRCCRDQASAATSTSSAALGTR